MGNDGWRGSGMRKEGYGKAKKKNEGSTEELWDSSGGIVPIGKFSFEDF